MPERIEGLTERQKQLLYGDFKPDQKTLEQYVGELDEWHRNALDDFSDGDLIRNPERRGAATDRAHDIMTAIDSRNEQLREQIDELYPDSTYSSFYDPAMDEPGFG